MLYKQRVHTRRGNVLREADDKKLQADPLWLGHAVN